jgi:tripartite-type tricarboxylate transporter receptor subunit TctC
MWMMRTGCAVIAAAGISFASATADAVDDSALAFYRGKQIHFFTMGRPGGGYDAYTRTVEHLLRARHQHDRVEARNRVERVVRR